MGSLLSPRDESQQLHPLTADALALHQGSGGGAGTSAGGGQVRVLADDAQSHATSKSGLDSEGKRRSNHGGKRVKTGTYQPGASGGNVRGADCVGLEIRTGECALESVCVLC